MIHNSSIELSDDVIRLLYHHLPLDSILSLIQVNRAAYAIAVDEPRLVQQWLQELPGNQAILRTMNHRELLAVLNQRARFNLLNVRVWSNVTDLVFSRTVGGFLLNPGSAVVSRAGKSQHPETNRATVDLDKAIINMAHDDDGSVYAYAVIAAAGARKAFVYSIRDQIIRHSDTIFDPFPEEIEVNVSIAKITTWDTEELGLSILYCHEKGGVQRWSISHYPVRCSQILLKKRQTFNVSGKPDCSEYVMRIDDCNEWQRDYFVDQSSTTHGGRLIPLAMSITGNNRCVIAWRHDGKISRHWKDAFIPTVTVTTYDPYTIPSGQRLTRFGLLAYVNRDILTQRQDWKESRGLVAYALSHICDLETFEDLDLVSFPPGEQVTLQISSQSNPFDFSHAGLLCHYKMNDVFGDIDEDHLNVLSFDSSPDMFLSPLTANLERLDFLSSADYYYVGPTLAYMLLPNGQNGWLQLVSRDRLWIQRVFLAGNFFFMADEGQLRLSKLLVNLLEWPGAEAVHGLNGKTMLSHHHNLDNQTCRIAVADGCGVRVWSIRLAHFIETNFGTQRQPETKSGVEEETPTIPNPPAPPSLSRADILFREADYPDVFRYHHFETGQYDIVSLHPARFDAGGVVQQLQVTSDRLLVLTNEGIRHWYFGREARGLRRRYGFEDNDDDDDKQE